MLVLLWPRVGVVLVLVLVLTLTLTLTLALLAVCRTAGPGGVFPSVARTGGAGRGCTGGVWPVAGGRGSALLGGEGAVVCAASWSGGS